MLKERDKQLQLYSTFAIKKRNIQWLLKQSLNLFKLIQHRFNFDSACFNTVERGGGGGGGLALFSGFNIAIQHVEANVADVGQCLYNLFWYNHTGDKRKLSAVIGCT